LTKSSKALAEISANIKLSQREKKDQEENYSASINALSLMDTAMNDLVKTVELETKNKTIPESFLKQTKD
jgi:hypothetical protein